MEVMYIIELNLGQGLNWPIVGGQDKFSVIC